MQSNSKDEKPKISVADFVAKAPAEMQIEVLAGAAGMKERFVVSARIQKLGLALAGFTHYIHAGRIQMVGQSEIWYLSQQPTDKRKEAILNLNLEDICCVLITKHLDPPPELVEIAERLDLPLLRTRQVSSTAIGTISRFLEDALAPQIILHGVLMEIYGTGVLFKGESGIGKSECALDLISRGHRLVSDDVVLVKRIGEKIEGASPELTFEHLEIRGLGIINIRDLFGVSAVSGCREVNLCIELKRWEKTLAIERLGIETEEEDIFGVILPKFVLPVSSGRNLSTLVETATRVHLLKKKGYDAAHKLIEKHTQMLSTPTAE